MSQFSIEQLLQPIETAVPANRQEAIEAANRFLDNQWPYLPLALAQRAGALLELMKRVHDEEVRSF